MKFYNKNAMLIREIQQKDNESIAKVIRDIFHELDAPKVGTAYADPILDTLYEVYQAPSSIYYVVENDGKIGWWLWCNPVRKCRCFSL